MHSPFITVITATYNTADTLPRLLDSLARQSFRDFEIAIQDGASSDGTLAVAENFRSRLPFLSLASEPDTGIYDAWNKALSRVHGEWILFLGADDVLADSETFARVRETLAVLPDFVLFAAGDVIICDGPDVLSLQEGLGQDAPERLQEGSSAMHSGLFQRARVFSGGGFDTSFRITGDHDFIIRHWRHASNGVRLGFPVTRMGVGGMTSNVRSILPFRYEFFKVMYKHFGLRKALPFLPGVVKGIIPYLLVQLWGQEAACVLYGKLRAFRKLPRAVIK